MIDALAPAGLEPGPVQVVVTVKGVGSAPFTTTANSTIFAGYAPPHAAGSSLFVTAALAGTDTLVGNPATDPRVSRPARAGDTLDLYMIGLGATEDPYKVRDGPHL